MRFFLISTEDEMAGMCSKHRDARPQKRLKNNIKIDIRAIGS